MGKLVMVKQMMKSAAVLAIAAAGLALAPAGVGMAQTATYRPLVSDTLPVGEIALQNDSRYTLTLVTISRCSQSPDPTNRLIELIRPRQGKRWRVDEGCWNLQATLNRDGEVKVVNYPIVEVLGGTTMHLTVNGPEGGPRVFHP